MRGRPSVCGATRPLVWELAPSSARRANVATKLASGSTDPTSSFSSSVRPLRLPARAIWLADRGAGRAATAFVAVALPAPKPIKARPISPAATTPREIRAPP